MESAGLRLKNLRLAKGLSLEEVQKKTKIHLNILKAIEEDSLIGLNPIYIRGFLKIYCKFLGADPRDYIPEYKEPQSAVKINQGLSDAIEDARPFLKTSPVKLNAFRGIKIKIKTVFIIIAILVCALILFNIGKFVSYRVHIRKAKPLVLIPEKATTDKVKSKSAAAKLLRSEVTTPKRDASSVIRLGLRAKGDCWVELRVDGRLFFRGILKKGKFESWSAKEKMEFSLSNAGVVEVQLDGKVIPPLGRKGQAIKNARITKNEGLVVAR